MDSILLPAWEPVALDEIARPPSWHGRAACADYPEPEIFYQAEGGSYERARAVCETCPVQEACLRQALSMAPKDDWGVWGGLSRGQRRELRRERVGEAA